ncbi:MAG TPA: hypothetical protein VFY47_04530 [Thermoleophilaceae bacterium]|nr:hypothetical protein [Thermoleophilaceae bacterium]
MDSPRFSRDLLAFLIGVPLAWAVLLLFHPGGEASDVYGSARDEVTAFLVVHLGTLLFIPLMAGAIYLLLRGIPGTAAKVARISLIPFVVFYSAWETLQGIANGVLVDQVNALPAADRAAGAELVQDFAESPLVRDMGVLGSLGSLALIVATIAAGMALKREAGAPTSVAVLLGISGFLISAHPPPFGPTGLALFIAAVLLLARSRSAPAPVPLAQAT